MDRTSVCDFCLRFWTIDTKEWELPMGGFEREITEMESSAAAGCHSCAIFCANTELLEPYMKNMQLLPKGHNRVFVVLQEEVLALCGLHSPVANTPLKHVLQLCDDLDPKLSNVHQEPYTGSVSSFCQAREWLNDCRENHSACRSKPKYQPTRLLHIDAEDHMVYLRHKEEFPSKLAYATLSHCWGQGVPQRLLKDNVADFKQGVPITKLAKTFQEAVTVCEELSMNYIWIDCFCIIQDCPEDWKVEALRMAQVYGNSILNIAATDSRDSCGGLFRERHVNALRPFRVSLADIFEKQQDEETLRRVEQEIEDDPKSFGPYFYLTDIGLCWDRFEQAPLNCRSWVLQERLLSPRVLHFDKDQLVWECDSLTACDRFPGPQGIAGLVPDKKRIRASIDKLRDIKDPNRPLGQELHDIWRPNMESYTSAGLTRPTDRLIALDGIAKRLSEVYDCGYAAGLFTRNMESQLAWRLKRTGEPRTPDVDIAPSWSWARFPGRVDTLPQWESVDLDQESRRLTSEELRETQLCEIMNKEELAKAWSPICDSKELPLDVRCFMAEVRLLDFAEIKAWPKEEHRLVVWRREDADNGKGPVTSNDSLPFDEERPLHDLWPLFYNGSDLGLWEGQSGVPLAVDSLTKTQEDTFQVSVDYDIWTDYRKRRTLHLMPAYEVTEYRPDDIWDKYNVRTIHGVVLERLQDNGSCFRRIGVFSIDGKKRQEFWRAAICTDVPGLTKHMMRVETWPNLNRKVKYDQPFKYYVKESAPQHRISLV